MNPYNISLLCFGFCSLLLGLLVWLKRGDTVGKRYLVMASFYSGWAIFIAVNLSNDVSPRLGLLMGRLGNVFAIFIPISWYHFVVTYAGVLEKRRYLIKPIYILSVTIACFAFSPWFIPRVAPMVGFKYYSQAGPVYYLFTLLFITLVPLSFLELYKKMKTSEGYEKMQMKGMLLTSLIGYIGGSPSFFPIYGIPFPQFTLLLLPLYPFALAYFMIRQKIFDVEELAQAAHRDKLTAIGVLAASINHEVRNPLFVIKGMAESCLERQKEGVFPNEKKALESANDAMNRSVQQADRAMDIIKRLSLFAKAGIESELKFESVKLDAVLEDILPLVRYELAEHRIALVREIPVNLPPVQADKRYLEEILFNLLVNASQAIKEGGKLGEIKITAALSRPGLKKLSETGSLEGDQRVVIEIADTGPGIPEDKIKDVFRPFYTTKEEGTGLGLYITKQLVEKIRGRIDVNSKLGAGTEFRVSLEGTV